MRTAAYWMRRCRRSVGNVILERCFLIFLTIRCALEIFGNHMAGYCSSCVKWCWSWEVILDLTAMWTHLDTQNDGMQMRGRISSSAHCRDHAYKTWPHWTLHCCRQGAFFCGAKIFIQDDPRWSKKRLKRSRNSGICRNMSDMLAIAGFPLLVPVVQGIAAVMGCLGGLALGLMRKRWTLICCLVSHWNVPIWWNWMNSDDFGTSLQFSFAPRVLLGSWYLTVKVLWSYLLFLRCGTIWIKPEGCSSTRLCCWLSKCFSVPGLKSNSIVMFHHCSGKKRQCRASFDILWVNNDNIW